MDTVLILPNCANALLYYLIYWHLPHFQDMTLHLACCLVFYWVIHFLQFINLDIPFEHNNFLIVLHYAHVDCDMHQITAKIISVKLLGLYQIFYSYSIWSE